MKKVDLWVIPVLAVIILGIYLRVSTYLQCNGLWLDETFLATNIVKLNALELLGKLEYDQSSPIGFLVVVKLITSLFGYSPLAWHSFSLITGVLVIPLIYILVRKITNNNTIPLIFTFITAISPDLIYYSVELKQYSAEVFFSTLFLLSFIEIYQKDKIVLFFICSILLILFVNLAPFMIVLSALLYMYKKWTFTSTKINSFLFMCFILAVLYTLVFFISIIHSHNSQFLHTYWTVHNGFLPLPISNTTVLKFLDGLSIIFSMGSSISAVIVVFIMIISGILLFKNSPTRKNNFHLIILSISLILTIMILSIVHLYPIAPRFVLALYPFIVLIFSTVLSNISIHWQKVIFVLLPIIIFPATLRLLLFIHGTFHYKITYYKGIESALTQLHTEYKDESICIDYYGDRVVNYYLLTLSLSQLKNERIVSPTDYILPESHSTFCLQNVSQDSFWLLLPRYPFHTEMIKNDIIQTGNWQINSEIHHGDVHFYKFSKIDSNID